MISSFFASLFNLTALVAGWTGGLMGFESTGEKLLEAGCEIQVWTENALTILSQQMTLVWQKLESDFISEAMQTVVSAREAIAELTCIATDTVIVAQESIRGSLGLGYLLTNKTSVLKDIVDDVFVQLRFEVEIGLIMLYLFIIMLCGTQLDRIERIQKPTAFVLLERDMVRLLRIACKLSFLFHILYITGKLFYFLVLSRSQAGPDEVLPWIILPIILVIAINIGRFLKTALSLYVFSSLCYILWIPINLVLYPIFVLLYVIILQPTVWLVRVYKHRHQYGQQFAVYVIRLLIIIVPAIVILVFEVITTHISETINLGVGLLLAMLTTYVLYYITACTIIVNYYPGIGTKCECAFHKNKIYCKVCHGEADLSACS